MINKKANVAITLLVLMTLLIFGVALFSFYKNSSELKLKIVDSSSIDNVYVQEINIKNEVSELAKNKFISEYSKIDFANEDAKSSEKQIEDNLGEITYTGLDEKTRKFSAKLDGDILLVSSEEFPISGSITIKDKKRVWLWDVVPTFSYDSIKANVGIIYRPSMQISLNLTKFGLESVEKVVSTIKNCKKLKDNREIEVCFNEKLVNFDSSVAISSSNGESEKKEIAMISKREFLINLEPKKIEFRVSLT